MSYPTGPGFDPDDISLDDLREEESERLHMGFGSDYDEDEMDDVHFGHDYD